MRWGREKEEEEDAGLSLGTVVGCFRVSAFIFGSPLLVVVAGKGFSLLTPPTTPFSWILVETPPPPPATLLPGSCFLVVSVGEVRPEVGGLWQGVAVAPLMSTVGEVREEIGVSIVGGTSG